MPAPYYVGTAGWSLPKAAQARFPAEGSHLERYAAVLPAAEINSSFYRPHKPATYARWAESVPSGFRFSVKIPKRITHELRLKATGEAIDGFLAEATSLGDKLGCLLVQLPPSLKYDARAASTFLAVLRRRYTGPVAFEPRHPSWFEAAPERLLVKHRVARVAADPATVPAAAEPGGDRSVVYYRLHGSPRIYYSDYDDAYLDALAGRLRNEARAAGAVWCVFDNTAAFAATGNALGLLDRLG